MATFDLLSLPGLVQQRQVFEQALAAINTSEHKELCPTADPSYEATCKYLRQALVILNEAILSIEARARQTTLPRE